MVQYAKFLERYISMLLRISQDEAYKVLPGLPSYVKSHTRALWSLLTAEPVKMETVIQAVHDLVLASFKIGQFDIGFQETWIVTRFLTWSCIDNNGAIMKNINMTQLVSKFKYFARTSVLQECTRYSQVASSEDLDNLTKYLKDDGVAVFSELAEIKRVGATIIGDNELLPSIIWPREHDNHLLCIIRGVRVSLHSLRTAATTLYADAQSIIMFSLLHGFKVSFEDLQDILQNTGFRL